MSEESKAGDLPDSMYRNPAMGKTTMKRNELQKLLLRTDGWVTACGRSWDIKSQHIGAGVYKVWLKVRE